MQKGPLPYPLSPPETGDTAESYKAPESRGINASAAEVQGKVTARCLQGASQYVGVWRHEPGTQEGQVRGETLHHMLPKASVQCFMGAVQQLQQPP